MIINTYPLERDLSTAVGLMYWQEKSTNRTSGTKEKTDDTEKPTFKDWGQEELNSTLGAESGEKIPSVATLTKEAKEFSASYLEDIKTRYLNALLESINFLIRDLDSPGAVVYKNNVIGLLNKTIDFFSAIKTQQPLSHILEIIHTALSVKTRDLNQSQLGIIRQIIDNCKIPLSEKDFVKSFQLIRGASIGIFPEISDSDLETLGDELDE